MSEFRLKLTPLEGGQPRSYADSRYRCRLDMEFDPPTTKEPYTVRWTGDALFRNAARIAWGWYGDGEAIKFASNLPKNPHLPKTAWEPKWHEKRITEVKEIGPGVAEVLIIQPFLD